MEITHKVYFISGLGAKCSIFDKIELPNNFQKIYIEWILPLKNESLDNYTKRMASQIDDNEEFSLVGLSFGGILIQEITKFKKPKKIIILSSIIHENEIKGWLNFVKQTKIYKILPKFVFKNKGFFMYMLLRKIYNRKNRSIKKYIINIEPYYYTWGMDKILTWKKNYIIDSSIFRIHGTKDIVFPLKKINQEDLFIQGGTHILVLQKPNEISKYLNKILN